MSFFENYQMLHQCFCFEFVLFEFWLLFRISNFDIRAWFLFRCFLNYRPKDIRQLTSFLNKFESIFFQFLTAIYQFKPVTTLFGFLPANLDSHRKVFFAQRFVGFNIVGSD